jgi:dTMP kinase
LKPAKLVTFEGIEGSGKSLQMTLLEAELRRRGAPFRMTREPGGTDFGVELRRVLLRKDGPPRAPLAELLLYLADRRQHLSEVIEPALASGLNVFCDRYHHATLAYQGHARGLGFGLIDRLADLLEVPLPDLAVVFDLDARTALSRAHARIAAESGEQWSRFEAESLDFHEKVREGYRLLARRDPSRVVLLDASGSSDDIFKSVTQLLESRSVLEPGQP